MENISLDKSKGRIKLGEKERSILKKLKKSDTFGKLDKVKPIWDEIGNYDVEDVDIGIKCSKYLNKAGKTGLLPINSLFTECYKLNKYKKTAEIQTKREAKSQQNIGTRQAGGRKGRRARTSNDAKLTKKEDEGKIDAKYSPQTATDLLQQFFPNASPDKIRDITNQLSKQTDSVLTTPASGSSTTSQQIRDELEKLIKEGKEGNVDEDLASRMGNISDIDRDDLSSLLKEIDRIPAEGGNPANLSNISLLQDVNKPNTRDNLVQEIRKQTAMNMRGEILQQLQTGIMDRIKEEAGEEIEEVDEDDEIPDDLPPLIDEEEEEEQKLNKEEERQLNEYKRIYSNRFKKNIDRFNQEYDIITNEDDELKKEAIEEIMMRGTDPEEYYKNFNLMDLEEIMRTTNVRTYLNTEEKESIIKVFDDKLNKVDGDKIKDYSTEEVRYVRDRSVKPAIIQLALDEMRNRSLGGKKRLKLKKETETPMTRTPGRGFTNIVDVYRNKLKLS
jgi:hypothetical protein